MKEFISLSNAELVEDTKRSVKIERRATLAVIDRIREIARRSIHLETGYSSLHEFLVVELGYSDGSAYRRIHAMKLCEDLPRAKEAIAEGTLSLCTAASLQNHLNKQSNCTIEAREALLDQVQGKSKRECERILNPDRIGTNIQFVADDQTLADLKRLSELLAIPHSDMSRLIKKIAQVARVKLDPMSKKPREPKRASPVESEQPAPEAKKSNRSFLPPEKLQIEKPQSANPHSANPSRYIKAWIKKAVWTRDNAQCSFVNPITQKHCSSRYGLQIDHVVPVSCGGESTLENLRLLCFSHHHLVTERVFGKEKIQTYISSN